MPIRLDHTIIPAIDGVTLCALAQSLVRLRADGIAYWADPGRTEIGMINQHDGGRGVYFASPDDHLFEIITVPYGG